MNTFSGAGQDLRVDRLGTANMAEGSSTVV